MATKQRRKVRCGERLGRWQRFDWRNKVWSRSWRLCLDSGLIPTLILEIIEFLTRIWLHKHTLWTRNQSPTHLLPKSLFSCRFQLYFFPFYHLSQLYALYTPFSFTFTFSLPPFSFLFFSFLFFSFLPFSLFAKSIMLQI